MRSLSRTLAPALGAAVWISVVATTVGCTISREGDGLATLGIDDGASQGADTEQRVEPDDSALLDLDTGASLYVPTGAVTKATRVGLHRIEDQEALEYIERLGSSRAVLSAPYAVTPYRDFELELDLFLPVVARSRSARVGVFSLEDEDDETWSLIARPEESKPGQVHVSLARGGIFIAVDLERLEDEPDAAGQGAGNEDAGDKEDAATSMDAAVATDAGPIDITDAGGPGKPTTPTGNVDLLFMIDNSGSMAEEQKKLSDVLDDMIRVLTTGQLNPSNPNPTPQLPPVESLHIGVISSDMGVNGAPPQKSCGALSFKPTERDPASATEFLVKPLGDDGILQTSTEVAVAGIYAAAAPGASPVLKVPGDPACLDVTFPPDERFVSFSAGITSPDEAARRLGCIAKLGRNGCGLEQQLEAMLKALTPPDSLIKFSASASNGRQTHGHGNAINPVSVSGINRGFLREDAVLVVVLVSDEEDCSIPDLNRAIFDAQSQAVPGEINVRCGLPQNQGRLFPVQRYVDGLRSLKPAAYQDRILVAALAGSPVKENVGSATGVTSGAAAIQALLNRPDMQFKVQRNMAGTAEEPVPTCINAAGDGAAAPARRFLELAKEFGENGLVTSICEHSYASLLQALIEKIAKASGRSPSAP